MERGFLGEGISGIRKVFLVSISVVFSSSRTLSGVPWPNWWNPNSCIVYNVSFYDFTLSVYPFLLPSTSFLIYALLHLFPIYAFPYYELCIICKHVTDSHTTMFCRNDFLCLECPAFPFDLINSCCKSPFKGTSLNPDRFQGQTQTLQSTVLCRVLHHGSCHAFLSFQLDYKEGPCIVNSTTPLAQHLFRYFSVTISQKSHQIGRGELSSHFIIGELETHRYQMVFLSVRPRIHIKYFWI